MNQLAFSLESKYGGTIGATGKATLGQLITNTLDAAIAVAGVIVVFLFITAGYQIITAAGNNDPKRHSQGTQTLTYAIIGFIIVFSSYWIIRLLETLLSSPYFGTLGVPGA